VLALEPLRGAGERVPAIFARSVGGGGLLHLPASLPLGAAADALGGAQPLPLVARGDAGLIGSALVAADEVFCHAYYLARAAFVARGGNGGAAAGGARAALAAALGSFDLDADAVAAAAEAADDAESGFFASDADASAAASAAADATARATAPVPLRLVLRAPRARGSRLAASPRAAAGEGGDAADEGGDALQFFSWAAERGDGSLDGALDGALAAAAAYSDDAARVRIARDGATHDAYILGTRVGAVCGLGGARVGDVAAWASGPDGWLWVALRERGREGGCA